MIELYTGEMLFSVHEDVEHLAMFEKLFGPIPVWMLEKAIDGDDGPDEFKNIIAQHIDQ